MRYFEFLYGSGIIASLWIFQKNSIDNISPKSQKKQTLIAFILVNTTQYPHTLKNNIYHVTPNATIKHIKHVMLPFFHSYANPVFGHVLIHYLVKTHVLVVTLKLIWMLLLNILSFNFVPKLSKFLLGWQDSEEAL